MEQNILIRCKNNKKNLKEGGGNALRGVQTQGD